MGISIKAVFRVYGVFSYGFYFSACQHNAGIVLFKNREVMKGFFVIYYNFSSHSPIISQKSAFCGEFFRRKAFRSGLYLLKALMILL